MLRDERIYAFIVDHTARSRFTSIRRISIHRRWLRASLGLCLVLCCAATYGLYSLSQEVAHQRIENENRKLKMENEAQRQQLNKLKHRVEAVEDATRRLSEISGSTGQPATPAETNQRGAGGPSIQLDATAIAALEQRASRLEKALQSYEYALRERARIPSIWPVEGRLTDGFGLRGNPFGGSSSEFHSGEDIATAWGTPVVAAGGGTVTFAGTQTGYGQVVILDHGNGLTTRYGHLSRIEVVVGQELARGDELGCVGSTGRSTGPHLHYEVRINDTAINPRGYLPDECAGAPAPTEAP